MKISKVAFDKIRTSLYEMQIRARLQVVETLMLQPGEVLN